MLDDFRMKRYKEQMPKYDLAISFAGEQRKLARSLAERLNAAGFSIFFDEFEEGELWGRDLTIALADAYARDSRWCLVLLSEAYLKKPWTNLERQNALHRFMQERQGYLLCLRLDEAKLPGLPEVIGYLNFKDRDEDSVYALLLQKLGRPSHDDFISKINARDRELAQEVIQACYRRAIFSKMDSEIELAAMYSSIGAAIGQIQRLIPRIGDQKLQFTSLKIVRFLDEIQRDCYPFQGKISMGLPKKLKQKVDGLKLDVVRLLLEIRRAGAIAIQLPLALKTDNFFGIQSANEPPNRLE